MSDQPRRAVTAPIGEGDLGQVSWIEGSGTLLLRDNRTFSADGDPVTFTFPIAAHDQIIAALFRLRQQIQQRQP